MRDEAGARTALAPAPGPVLDPDPHGFAALYIRHRASFTSHARRYLRDPRDADEVVQEAFLRLFLAMPELESELQALAYGRRTITNLCIDRYRADARRPRLVALEGAPLDDLAEDDTGDPVVRAEDAAVVREALSKLPELHRAALVMREIEEKPLPVIADELDVAEDSVKHLLFRARRTLRKLLAGTSVAPGADGELTRGLRPVARGASGGAAGLLLLALLGLGSGPDLRAVPVVGVDLPDVLGVTAVADAVTSVVKDVVEVIAPAGPQEAEAAAGPASGPVSRSATAATSPARPPAAAGPQVASQPPTAAAAGEPSGAGAVRTSDRAAAAPGTARPTTVVTVVDGRQVVTVVPPTGPLAAAPGRSTDVSLPVLGTSTGRGAGASTPTPAGSLPSTGARDVVAAVPARPVVPAAQPPARPGGERGPRAEEAVQKAADKAADRAADATQREARTAGKRDQQAADAAPAAPGAAEPAPKAPARVEQSPEKAAAKAEQATDRADAAAEKAAGKAEAAAERAAEKVEAAAERTAGKAEAAAEKAADKAEAAAERAADKAADKAARDASDRAAEVAAQQAASGRAASRAAEQAATRAAEQAAAQAAAAQVAAVQPAPVVAVAP